MPLLVPLARSLTTRPCLCRNNITPALRIRYVSSNVTEPGPHSYKGLGRNRPCTHWRHYGYTGYPARSYASNCSARSRLWLGQPHFGHGWRRKRAVGTTVVSIVYQRLAPTLRRPDPFALIADRKSHLGHQVGAMMKTVATYNKMYSL